MALTEVFRKDAPKSCSKIQILHYNKHTFSVIKSNQSMSSAKIITIFMRFLKNNKNIQWQKVEFLKIKPGVTFVTGFS